MIYDRRQLLHPCTSNRLAYVVLEQRLQGGRVTLEARKRVGGLLNGARVGRKEREAMQLGVQDVKQGARAALVGGRIERRDLHGAKGGLNTGERNIVGWNSRRKRLGEAQGVVDCVDGDISGGRRIRNSRIVPAQT